MRFDEACKAIIYSLTRPEASVFVKFLESEIARHTRDIDEAKELIIRVRDMYRLDREGASPEP